MMRYDGSLSACPFLQPWLWIFIDILVWMLTGWQHHISIASSCMQYMITHCWAKINKCWEALRHVISIMIVHRTWLLWRLEACRTVFGDELTLTTTYGSWLSCHVKPQNRSEPTEIPQSFSDIGYNLSWDQKAGDQMNAISGAGWSGTRLKTWDVIRSFDKQDNRPWYSEMYYFNCL